MAITITQQKRFKMGNGWIWIGDIAFDSSYPTDGESVDGLIPFSNIDDVVFAGGNSGYCFEYDRTNKKVKVYTPTKHIVLASSNVTVTSDVATLAYLPAAILAIHGLVSSVSTNFKIVATARTLATGECKVNYNTGQITFYASDDPTSVTVDYIKAANAGAEVANGADLSALTGVRMIAFGY